MMSDWYESMDDINISENNQVITTFDNITHEIDELLDKMMDDNFYYGYLGKYALSSSSLKTLLKSPKLYSKSLIEKDIETQPLRDGKMFHWSILEPEKFEGIEIVDVKSRNTNKYSFALAEAIAEGRSPEVYTIKEKVTALNLKEELLKNVEAASYLEDADYEVPAIAMIDGIPFRGKADIIKGDKIIDLKTTGDIAKFKWSALNFSYDLQAYLYLQLFPNAKEFEFVVIDKKTFEIGIYTCSEDFLLSGKRKLQKGIKDYKHFFIEGNDADQYCIKECL
tara:strand:+ start:3496 stop:4335 length:840 start_codon:yes stop_codon:yes gene_type:complete